MLFTFNVDVILLVQNTWSNHFQSLCLLSDIAGPDPPTSKLAELPSFNHYR